MAGNNSGMDRRRSDIFVAQATACEHLRFYFAKVLFYEKLGESPAEIRMPDDLRWREEGWKWKRQRKA
jgi:hypothetical protein